MTSGFEPIDPPLDNLISESVTESIARHRNTRPLELRRVIGGDAYDFNAFTCDRTEKPDSRRIFGSAYI
jgi:hypothetical protein